MRRTVTMTWAPSFRKCSSKVETCARAWRVGDKCRRISCISTYAAAVSSTRNVFAKKFEQLVRPLCRVCGQGRPVFGEFAALLEKTAGGRIADRQAARLE